MGGWRVFDVDTECGFCSRLIVKDQPVFMRLGRLRRCIECAGEPVNQAEVDEARRLIQDRHIDAELARARARIKLTTFRESINREPFDPKRAAAEPQE